MKSVKIEVKEECELISKLLEAMEIDVEDNGDMSYNSARLDTLGKTNKPFKFFKDGKDCKGNGNFASFNPIRYYKQADFILRFFLSVHNDDVGEFDYDEVTESECKVFNCKLLDNRSNTIVSVEGCSSLQEGIVLVLLKYFEDDCG